MSRNELLKIERDRVLHLLSQRPANKARLLTELMDIDAEMEEILKVEERYSKK